MTRTDIVAHRSKEHNQCGYWELGDLVDWIREWLRGRCQKMTPKIVGGKAGEMVISSLKLETREEEYMLEKKGFFDHVEFEVLVNQPSRYVL